MSDLSLSDLSSQGGQRARRPRRAQHRRRRGRIAVGIALVLLVAACVTAYVGLRPVVDGLLESDDYPGPGTGEVIVQVAPGDPGAAIATTLAEAGVVKTRKAFLDATRAEPASAGIQPGSYRLRREMAAADALAALLDPTSRVALKVTLPEGLARAAAFDLLAAGTGLTVEELEAAAQDGAAIGLPPAAEGQVEGFLFPATYDFEPGVSADQVLRTLVERAVAELDALGVPPERRREVVTKASLVEAEARLPEDFGKVARVLENRLADGMPLQLDSTVLYAVGKSSITTTAQDRASDSPYNTYRFPGLPPGPINSPGTAALQAVLDPTPGEWRYFVSVNPDTGETRFAVTLEEHQENVALFQQWLRENDS
jgi:UPF0755 protein